MSEELSDAIYRLTLPNADQPNRLDHLQNKDYTQPMLIQKAIKLELNPNNRQISMLSKTCGVARFAYNWGLDRRKKAWKENKEKLNYYSLHKELIRLKKTDFPWMYEVSKSAPESALRDLDAGYNHFFRRVKQGSKNPGYPKFKKKGKSNDSFRFQLKNHRITKTHIDVPRIGQVRLKNRELLPKGYKINSVTVSRHGKRWFASIQGQIEIEVKKPESDKTIGIDFGLKHVAVLSDGTKYDNPRHLKSKLTKLKRESRRLSRKKKGSRNFAKQKLAVQILHYRISCLRSNSVHQFTKSVVKTKPKMIVIEDLNISGMMKNRKLARAIADAALYERRRQLEYKCLWNGIELVIADRFYPSSKTCSGCGHKKDELSLSERMFICDECGLKLDRDLNAALNLAKYGKSTLGSRGIQACEDPVRPCFDHQNRARSLNQEENIMGLSN